MGEGKTKKKKLTPRQLRFKEEYLACLNAEKAAKEAGFSENTARSKAFLWVGKSKQKCPKAYHHLWDEIQEALEEKSKESDASIDRFLKEVCGIAFLDPVQAFKDNSMELKNIHNMPEELRRCIQEISPVKSGGYKIKFYSKNKALHMIGQYLGAFIQRHQHSGPDDGPIQTESKVDLSKLSKDDLFQLREILARNSGSSTDTESSGN
jgi:phage terminase small subunit